ncbi:MAG TPA: type II toxin-antitoxin system Phd/YefM family antitoxin [Candidatus Latescibacteria bacterium]|jgi:prevent-host-death family protein|nr:type II toxin-antitoxin system Phd/YefM family antitoxin [Candidatus Latescibacterota bacterium]HJP33983.1 type II toxin-antitoxin system Phd/YefM family antitoxin [Candidatus Latescibacterota bacterium]
MTKVTSAVDARRNLGQLLNTVSLTQEDVVIERAGKPIARLTSCETAPRPSEGKLDLRRARGLGRDLWRELGVEAYLTRERAAWD